MKNYDETTDQITLTLDDDSELLCDVIATFPATVNGKEQMYIALLPTDATPEREIYPALPADPDQSTPGTRSRTKSAAAQTTAANQQTFQAPTPHFFLRSKGHSKLWH